MVKLEERSDDALCRVPAVPGILPRGKIVEGEKAAGEYHIWCRYLGDSSHLPAMSGPRIVTLAKRDVTVTAKNQTISIGQDFDTSVTGATITGQVAGHTLFSVTLTPSILDTSVVATGTMTIGHDAVIKAGDIDVTHNYAIAYYDGAIEVH